MAKNTKWETKLSEARELKKRGSELLFDRVQLLTECYDDAEFRRWHAYNGTNEVDYLDDELSDTAASFLTLKAVLAAYPDRDSWAKHNIRDLIAEVMEAEAKARKESKETDAASTRVSWKQLAEQYQSECERLRAEVETLKQTLEIVAGAKAA